MIIIYKQMQFKFAELVAYEDEGVLTADGYVSNEGIHMLETSFVIAKIYTDAMNGVPVTLVWVYGEPTGEVTMNKKSFPLDEHSVRRLIELLNSHGSLVQGRYFIRLNVNA